MSSSGCESGTWNAGTCVTTPGATFSHAITLNIYAVGINNVPGELLATKTQTFNIPYRPSASAVCGDGRWSLDGTSSTCFNGFATPISFYLTGFTMPSNVIISVAFNTTRSGVSPMGTTICSSTTAGCGYDYLNVGVETSLTVGLIPFPNDAYLKSTWSGAYCDNGFSGTGLFRLDAGCWGGYQPSFKIEAQAVAVPSPTNKDQCKNDGWKTFNNPTFTNQGQCVSYVASNNHTGNKK
jgi:uncharacterized protein YdhG (YjbR/CyaY superfamily)